MSRITPWLTGGYVGDDLLLSWPHIIAYISLGLTIILLGAIFILFRRLRTLCLVVAMMSSPNPGLQAVKAQAVTTPGPIKDQITPQVNPKLIWNTNYPSSAQNTAPPLNQNHNICDNQPIVPNHFLLTLELLILLSILIFLIKYGHSKLGTLRHSSEVYLEITDGNNFQDIYLITLTYCPTEYDLSLPCWVSSLSMLKRKMGPNDLLISWPQFGLLETNTSQYIPLPKTIRLSYLQARRAAKILSGPYSTYPKIVHAGRAFYINLKQRPNNPDESIIRPHSPAPTQ